jgi:general stress protein 26
MRVRDDSMHDGVDRVWELMKRAPICMMSTWDGDELRVRPMAAHLAREDNAIRFLTDARWHADDEIIAYPKVALAFSDGGSQKYVAVCGRGAISNDRARIKALFSIAARAWWETADDPNIRLLTVTPVGAEYWDGRGKVVSAIGMAVAVATGRRPRVGESRKISMG